MDRCLIHFTEKERRSLGHPEFQKVFFVFFHRKINLLASTQCLVHMDYCGAVCADLKVLSFNEH